MTGLRPGQLTELAARAAAAIGDVVKPGGGPAVIGLTSRWPWWSR
jgi:hypothetical protein